MCPASLLQQPLKTPHTGWQSPIKFNRSCGLRCSRGKRSLSRGRAPRATRTSVTAGPHRTNAALPGGARLKPNRRLLAPAHRAIPRQRPGRQFPASPAAGGHGPPRATSPRPGAARRPGIRAGAGRGGEGPAARGAWARPAPAAVAARSGAPSPFPAAGTSFHIPEGGEGRLSAGGYGTVPLSALRRTGARPGREEKRNPLPRSLPPPPRPCETRAEAAARGEEGSVERGPPGPGGQCSRGPARMRGGEGRTAPRPPPGGPGSLNQPRLAAAPFPSSRPRTPFQPAGAAGPPLPRDSFGRDWARGRAQAGAPGEAGQGRQGLRTAPPPRDSRVPLSAPS